jgi:hypothetical protein
LVNAEADATPTNAVTTRAITTAGTTIFECLIRDLLGLFGIADE